MHKPLFFWILVVLTTSAPSFGASSQKCSALLARSSKTRFFFKKNLSVETQDTLKRLQDEYGLTIRNHAVLKKKTELRVKTLYLGRDFFSSTGEEILHSLAQTKYQLRFYKELQSYSVKVDSSSRLIGKEDGGGELSRQIFTLLKLYNVEVYASNHFFSDKKNTVTYGHYIPSENKIYLNPSSFFGIGESLRQDVIRVLRHEQVHAMSNRDNSFYSLGRRLEFKP